MMIIVIMTAIIKRTHNTGDSDNICISYCDVVRNRRITSPVWSSSMSRMLKLKALVTIQSTSLDRNGQPPPPPPPSLSSPTPSSPLSPSPAGGLFSPSPPRGCGVSPPPVLPSPSPLPSPLPPPSPDAAGEEAGAAAAEGWRGGLTAKMSCSNSSNKCNAYIHVESYNTAPNQKQLINYCKKEKRWKHIIYQQQNTYICFVRAELHQSPIQISQQNIGRERLAHEQLHCQPQHAPRHHL
jgi:hypothetical protein